MTDATSPTLKEVPSESLVIGDTISGRYKVEGRLGQGGMGAVYLVQHILIRKRFALKMLHASTSQDPEMVLRFEREAVAAANVDHPNIAGATDFGRAESGGFFLVMEYLEGQRLRDALSSGPLPPRRALHIARQVAGALERSHALGIVHRDLGTSKQRRNNQEAAPQGTARESPVRQRRKGVRRWRADCNVRCRRPTSVKRCPVAQTGSGQAQSLL